ncbi:MAG: hypothetical protein IT369_05830 [Candidatus Latescibacteria bacterium]|nr:hypothetical protein [Candidatus Latescibacterota bacterium]
MVKAEIDRSAAVWSPRVEEAVRILRHKDVRSTTLERLRRTWEADQAVQGLPQCLQLGEGVYHLLDTIAVPVDPADLLLGRIEEEIPDAAGEAFFAATVAAWQGRAIPPWMPDGGHECFAWERLLEVGLSGLEVAARTELARRVAAGESQATLDYLRGAVRIYEAFRHYAQRYAAAARRVGLEAAARRCEALAEGPPSTFAEGLQLLWLVGHVYCTMLAANPTLTFGRLDELLLSRYRADLASGRLCREEAGDLIEDFYCKNNLILGRGEHQMSGNSAKATGWQRNLTYDAPQYIVLGGCRADGSPVANELTDLFLERVVPRFENPVVVLRYTDNLPAPTWRLAVAAMRANSSFMVYNDHRIIPAMVHCGIPAAAASTYTMHGCNWPDIPGHQREVMGYQAVLPQYFLDALGEVGEPLASIDELHARFAARCREEARAQCERFRQERRTWTERGPGLLRVDDSFLAGPIDQARSWQLGGVKFPTLTCAISSLATAADCFAAVEELVFAGRQVELDGLRKALKSDFAGEELLRRRCLRAPKFGQGDERADRHAVRLLHTVLDELDRACHLGAADQVTVFRCLETDMRHLGIGARTGATPDGRHAGQPTSENTSPYPGSCTRGVTAMFNSEAKLPLDRINSGALNVRLSPRLVGGEEGLANLMALLRAYFDLGGLQLQLSMAESHELRRAQQYPEEHRDLMVRITGYSAAFVDMDKNAQDEIIRREELETGSPA